MDFNGAYRITGNVSCSDTGSRPGNAVSDFVKADNIINQMEIYPY